MKLDSKDLLADLRKEVVKMNEKSFYQNPEALSLLALNEFKLGNKKSAVSLQSKAIEIIEESSDEGGLKVSLQPFKQALEKYSK